MERYDARFCRNSMMTSLAGIKSWNFCGRSGVNSATALRTALGSNVFITWDDLNANRETGWPRYGPDAAVAANHSLPVEIYGWSGFLAGLRTWKGHGGGLPAGISWPLLLPVQGLLPPLRHRGCGLFANVAVAMN